MTMRTILVIDDDRDFLNAISLVLEQHGFAVRTAATPEEGLAEIRRRTPDLVVLDVMMPEGHEGFVVARSIREELHLHSLPIVILSSIHVAKQVPYRFAPDEHYLPVDRFLDKPVLPELLIATINEVMGDHREEPKHPL
ncbi:MAG: response regulator [Deltaproteobacteria bacterium]|nr:response regulator [Deltaproteobacteria bacterium]